MRKLILISAFVLASVSAQAGQGLVLASNEPPSAATSAETAKAAEAQPAATETKTEASKPYASNRRRRPMRAPGGTTKPRLAASPRSTASTGKTKSHRGA